jgi:hypothetical protein
VAEISNGRNDSPLAGAGPSAAGGPEPEENKGWISALLKKSEPYRQIIGIMSGVVVATSAGVAWIVAHFATVTELHYLECRVTNNILTQLLPIHMEEFAGKIDWRAAQIKELVKQGGGSGGSISLVAELTDQINVLTNDQKESSVKLQKDMDEIAKQCISEEPAVGGKS